jgi:hypothetical protein
MRVIVRAMIARVIVVVSVSHGDFRIQERVGVPMLVAVLMRMWVTVNHVPVPVRMSVIVDMYVLMRFPL